jgi:lipopolysaccharide transport system permease protein
MANRETVTTVPSPAEVAVTRVEPSHGWRVLKLGNLWKYREMLYFLSWRDVKVRYKQTLLGAGWAILQPFLTMLIFLVLFRRIAKFPSGGVPYPIFAYAGLVVWIFFSYGITQASNSLVLNAELVRKVYFPRLAVPLAAILPGALDFAVASVILIGMMVFFLAVSIRSFKPRLG